MATNPADLVDLVTVATPNSTHFEITKAFLEAGFNVLCEKPMTMTVEEGEEIVRRSLEHIDKKRAALGLAEYDASKWDQVGDSRMLDIVELPLEERLEAVY